MLNLHMYMCDICGYSRGQPGQCPRCEIVLTEYTKETEREYQVNMEDAMRTMSELRWYL